MAVITSKLIVSLIDQLTAPARGIARTVQNLQAQSRANAVQMNEMRGRMVDAAAAAWALGKALADPVQKAVAFESAMADVAKVSDFSELGLAEFGRDLRRLATSEIPMAVTEMAALAENAAASGIADGDLLEFTRMTAKAALAWGVSGDQAGEDLAKIKEALRLNIDETRLYADAINYLADNSALKAPDLTNFARRVAAQGEFFGFSREQSLAFGSAMISAGATTEVAATSFRNMGRALTKGSSATPRLAKAYKTLGLNASKVAKGMQDDAVGTTMEVIKRLGQLPAEMQAAVMGDLFGDEARALAPLLSNVELLERSLGYVADEAQYAGSVQAEFARRAATTEFNLQRLKNQVDEVAMAIGNALLPAINGVAAAVGPVLIAVADWAAANPQIVQAIVALVGGLVALRVATLATRWAFLFAKGAFLDWGLALAKGANWMLAIINPLNLVRNAVGALRMALMFSGIGLILAGIAAAGLWIYNNWSGLVSFFEGFGTGLVAALGPVMPVIQPIADAGKQILDWVLGLLGPVGASADEWRDWGEAAGTAVGNAVMAVVETGGKILSWLAGLPEAMAQAWAGWQQIVANAMNAGADAVLTNGQTIIKWFFDLPTHIANGISNLAIAVVDEFANIGARIAEAFLTIDWVGIGVTLMNAIWEGMKSIIPNMLAGIGAAFSSLNPFGSGGATPAGSGNFDPRYPDLPVPGGIAGARAAGGSILGGRTYLVGEYGPELVTPGRNGFVHSAHDTAGMLGGRAGGSVSVSFGDIVIQGGSDPQATAEAVLHMLESRLKDALGGIYADIEYAG